MRFSDVIGQDAIKERLIRSFNEHRLAHAQMFYGQEGYGCLPLALAYANYIACPNRNEVDSCGGCSTCKKFDSLQFADLFFSYPYLKEDDRTNADTFGSEWREAVLSNPYLDLDTWREKLAADNKQLIFTVNEAGNIIHKLSLTSYEGGYKFMIVWMSDHLKEDVANKLLKIVEEPPQNTLFFFTAGRLDNILPTILSRVQTIHVPKIEEDVLISTLENQGLSHNEAEGISHFSDGNWSRALQLMNAEDPNELYAGQFQEWMRACYSKDVFRIQKMVEGLAGLGREGQKQFLLYALQQLRQNLMLNYVGDQLAKQNDMERSFSAKFAPFINHLNALDMMELMNEAFIDVARNANGKILFMDVSLRLHHLLRRQD